MSDLIKKNEELLKNIKDKSLTSKVSDLKTKLTHITKNKNLVLLCDVSGSMAAYCGNEGLRAIDILSHCISNFPGAQLWEFSSKVFKVQKLSSPNGSTNIGRAFAEMKINGYKEIVLLTDGQPNSESDALNNAQGLKINIIYIGPQPIPEFLRKLASATGGKFEDVELIGKQSEKELENKIKGFLNA